MKNIFFFSKKFNNYCKDKNAESNYIIGYYDIEVQKVLYNIGFCIKTSPRFCDSLSDANMSEIDAIFDLDNQVFVSGFDNEKMMGTLYLCK